MTTQRQKNDTATTINRYKLATDGTEMTAKRQKRHMTNKT